MRWADLTIRPVVKANSMSARWTDLTIRLVVKANSMSARWHDMLFSDGFKHSYCMLVHFLHSKKSIGWCDNSMTP